jgi:hypothetical protein
MTTEEIKAQQIVENEQSREENRKILEALVPIFDAELKALCEKHGVIIQGFCMRSDVGCQAGVRIALKKSDNAYNVK